MRGWGLEVLLTRALVSSPSTFFRYLNACVTILSFQLVYPYGVHVTDHHMWFMFVILL